MPATPEPDQTTFGDAPADRPPTQMTERPATPEPDQIYLVYKDHEMATMTMMMPTTKMMPTTMQV